MLNKAVVVLGPTCVGKTALALNLCRRFNGSLVSADSRQVVRYMDHGTGKVPIDKIGWAVPGLDIFGYDLVDPDTYFSAYDFINYCAGIFPQIARDGKNVFLVGGTGFYLDAVCGKISFALAPPNMPFRSRLENLSTGELAAHLANLDPERYKTIDVNNPARLIRALEKASQPSSSSASHSYVPRDALYIGLTGERGVLYQRSDIWITNVFTEKLFQEITSIQARFPTTHRLTGLVYKSALEYLAGASSLETAIQQAKFAMHAYIRRQQTWFKRNAQLKWFDISKQNFDADISSIVESYLYG